MKTDIWRKNEILYLCPICLLITSALSWLWLSFGNSDQLVLLDVPQNFIPKINTQNSTYSLNSSANAFAVNTETSIRWPGVRFEPENESWNLSFLEGTNTPETVRAWDDMTGFYSKLAEEYFRGCIEEKLQAVPRQLYLGTRFADLILNDCAVRSVAKYGDTIGYNIYKILPDDIIHDYGKPVIIGEFHMGVTDRGLFHPGLVRAKNQEDRAQMYDDFVR